MIDVPCDYCGSDSRSLVFQARDVNYHLGGVFDIVKCNDCSLVYLSPRPDEVELTNFYPDAYTCFKPGGRPSSLGAGHPLSVAAHSLGLRSGRICDVGAGAGDFLAAARGSGWEVAGIEPNEYARRVCDQTLGEKAVFGSWEAASFPPDYFDAVTLWHVMEHLSSPAEMLRRIRRVLKPGGLLGLAVPNFDSFERRLWGPHWIAMEIPRHLYHFTIDTLRSYLEKYGFQVMSAHQTPGANSLAANLLRTFRETVLDPRSGKTAMARNDRITAPAGSEWASSSHYAVNERTKENYRRVVMKLVYPAASLISTFGWGPELMVFARKATF